MDDAVHREVVHGLHSALLSEKLSEKVVQVCHIPGKGHKIPGHIMRNRPFPGMFWTQL